MKSYLLEDHRRRGIRRWPSVWPIGGAQADTIQIALAETPSDEMAAFFVALDRAKAAGLEYEWTAFADEELAIQAVLSGQMDIGFGTPYAAMQRSKAPIRIIFQLSKLKFFPVTTDKYSSLEDLDGEPIMLHSRGGGTDSIANVIEDKVGIKFGKRSYVPGSANRVVALMAGQADATIIDLSNKNKIMRRGTRTSSTCCRCSTSMPATRRCSPISTGSRRTKKTCRSSSTP